MKDFVVAVVVLSSLCLSRIRIENAGHVIIELASLALSGTTIHFMSERPPLVFFMGMTLAISCGLASGLERVLVEPLSNLLRRNGIFGGRDNGSLRYGGSRSGFESWRWSHLIDW